MAKPKLTAGRVIWRILQIALLAGLALMLLVRVLAAAWGYGTAIVVFGGMFAATDWHGPVGRIVAATGRGLRSFLGGLIKR